MSTVKQEIVPEPWIDDSQEQLHQRVQDQTHGQVRNLTVILHAGVVHLGGQCHKYYTKQLASQAAMTDFGQLKLCPVFDLDNAIEVF